MESCFLEYFDIQALEIIYRFYSDGQLLDMIFPKSDLKSVEMFSELFERNAEHFQEVTQEILKDQRAQAAGLSRVVLKAHCRGKVTGKKDLQIRVKEVRIEEG